VSFYFEVVIVEKCKHKWEFVRDGTLDLICVKCNKKAKQAVMMPTQIAEPSAMPIMAPIATPIMRETMTVQAYGNFFELDKENYRKDFYKQAGLYPSLFERSN
jgi:hypothetical protein